ncbi:M28 family peptidase [Sediminitomix flava]|uniref:Peptidase M28-like protein n=1 Tax=Sediminitomix flava TaxID=379075 RepID=A0A315Z8H8_SEDFL|nr:M28 family peptidase [Sediminitomix flava]PWJ40865.1 peptidase M28-like protein [Sediminitomix flava]
MVFHKSILAAATMVSMLVSCQGNQSSTTKDETTAKEVNVQAPQINADSAYAFVQKQVDFGPRVPNTPEHVACGDYLISTLERFGTTVHVQEFEAEGYDGTIYKGRNIMGQINPSASKRILLAAHWDTRFVADQDEESKHYEFIDGANDGGSGVAVLLEIARTLQQSSLKPNVGIDLLLFDVEDQGKPSFVEQDYTQPYKSYYCLGSTHWSKNKYPNGYHAYYGILLDMVGAKGATFPKEAYSMNYGRKIVRKLWKTAESLGYGHHFIHQEGDPITDDHVPVNEIAKIPMIDVIHQDLTGQGTFFEHWHTTDDTMENIDKDVLKAVGQSVLQLIYNEK